jgi:predicted glutamine amidotransferase
LHYKRWIDRDLQLHIKGETDSEIIFFIYLTFLRKYKPYGNRDGGGFYMIEALRQMFSKFIQLGHEVSANLIFANQSYIIITRYLWYDPKKHATKQHALSLYYSLCDGIVVSSEPLTTDYQLIPENTALLIDIEAETMVAYSIL